MSSGFRIASPVGVRTPHRRPAVQASEAAAAVTARSYLLVSSHSPPGGAVSPSNSDDRQRRAYAAASRMTRDRMAAEAPLAAEALASIEASDIVVVPGRDDHVEQVLAALGLPHVVVHPGQLGQARLHPGQLLVVTNRARMSVSRTGPFPVNTCAPRWSRSHGDGTVPHATERLRRWHRLMAVVRGCGDLRGDGDLPVNAWWRRVSRGGSEWPERGLAVFTVIHVSGEAQALEQSDLALSCGADGLFLINPCDGCRRAPRRVRRSARGGRG